MAVNKAYKIPRNILAEMTNNIAQGYQDIGQAQVGYQLAKGQVNSGLLGGVLNTGFGLAGFKGFF